MENEDMETQEGGGLKPFLPEEIIQLDNLKRSMTSLLSQIYRRLAESGDTALLLQMHRRLEGLEQRVIELELKVENKR